MDISNRTLGIACALTIGLGVALRTASQSSGDQKSVTSTIQSRKLRPIPTADFGVLQSYGDLDHHVSKLSASKITYIQPALPPVKSEKIVPTNDDRQIVDDSQDMDPLMDGTPPDQSSDGSN